jgi:hypothetical protein
MEEMNAADAQREMRYEMKLGGRSNLAVKAAKASFFTTILMFSPLLNTKI